MAVIVGWKSCLEEQEILKLVMEDNDSNIGIVPEQGKVIAQRVEGERNSEVATLPVCDDPRVYFDLLRETSVYKREIHKRLSRAREISKRSGEIYLLKMR
jgi:hypothetical protein